MDHSTALMDDLSFRVTEVELQSNRQQSSRFSLAKRIVQE